MFRPAFASARFFAGVGLALILSECAGGPNYVAPRTELAPLHNLPAALARRNVAEAPDLETWWTGFGNPMLVTVVQRALAQNLDLAASLARGRNFCRRSMSTAQPVGNTRASTSHRVHCIVPGFQRDQSEYAVGSAASWEITLFAGLRRQAGAAGDEAEAAEAAQAGTRVSVAADAADSYLQMRGYQTRPAAAQKQVETDARQLQAVQARHAAGQADAREVAQAEALLIQLELHQTEQEGQVAALTRARPVSSGIHRGLHSADGRA